MNVENASLVLRSFDLNTTEDNYGVVNSTNTVMTWKNIDLRTLLGTMYNNYDLFNLTLNSIATSKVKQAYNATASANNGYAMGDAENLATMVQISGLPFINQTYDMKTNVNKSTTLIGAFTFPNAIKWKHHLCINYQWLSRFDGDYCWHYLFRGQCYYCWYTDLLRQYRY